MNIAEIIVVFVMSSWFTFMVSLPIGNKYSNKNTKEEEGFASSAPKNPNIGKKFAISLCIGALITFLCNYFVA